MSKSTISTFKLFEIFPDEEAARQYLEFMEVHSLLVAPEGVAA